MWRTAASSLKHRFACGHQCDGDSAAKSSRMVICQSTQPHGSRAALHWPTAENVVDVSILPAMGSFNPTGAVPELALLMRQALDNEGFNHVKIIVSGGFGGATIGTGLSPVTALVAGRRRLAASHMCSEYGQRVGCISITT